jgi:polysaccharide biosynthesis/export protein
MMRRCLLALFLLSAVTASAQTNLVGPPVQAGQEPRDVTLAGTVPAPTGASADYKLVAQDVLKITVFDEPTLTGTFRIDQDGQFQFPLIGRVQASGRTLREVELDVRTRLEDGWVRRPQVAAEVEQYRTRNVFIGGEVRTPGKYPLGGQTTILEALAQAGYMTPTAGSELLVLHPEANGPTDRQLSPEQTSAARTTRVNLTDLIAGRSAGNIILNEGDTIWVSRAETFFVSGHVRSPGRFTWERGLTVQQALSLAGGISEKGSNRRLKVTRLVNGTSKKLDIKLNDAIQPNDLIEVQQRLL